MSRAMVQVHGFGVVEAAPSKARLDWFTAVDTACWERIGCSIWDLAPNGHVNGVDRMLAKMPTKTPPDEAARLVIEAATPKAGAA